MQALEAKKLFRWRPLRCYPRRGLVARVYATSTPNTSRRALQETPRGRAAKQLLRIEEDGAYSGLVNGSPVSGQLDDDGGENEELPQSQRATDQEQLRDQRAVRELVSGVTRWRRQLDYVISSLTGRSAGDLEPLLRALLRLGAYELLHGGLPPHAITEHVTLAGSMLRPGAAGFANGVLRSLTRAMEAGTVPDPLAAEPASSGRTRDRSRQLSIAYSHPTWLVSRWLKRYGEEATVGLLVHNNAAPSHSLRLNTLSGVSMEELMEELRGLGVDPQRSEYLPHEFVRLERGLQAVLRCGLLQRGVVCVQDESCGLVVAALDPQPGDRLLDCCAAPGGKTLAAANRMAGRGSIVAADVSEARLRLVRRAASDAGLLGTLISCVPGDLRDLAAATTTAAVAEGGGEGRGGSVAGGRRQSAAAAAAASTSVAADASSSAAGSPPKRSFDKVLLDAPCSGTGVLCKRADMRWRRGPEHIQQLAALQAELLDAAAHLVAPGGVLVYSTCSIEGEENQVQVEAFLGRDAGRGFRVQRLDGGGSGGGGGGGGGPGGPGGTVRRSSGSSSRAPPPPPRLPPGVVTPEGYLATLPSVHGVDGAFAARLVRTE